MISEFLQGQHVFITSKQIEEYYKKESVKTLTERMNSLFYEIGNRVSVVVGGVHLEDLYPYFMADDHIKFDNIDQKYIATVIGITELNNYHRRDLVVLVEDDKQLCKLILKEFGSSISIINFGGVLKNFTY